MRGAQGKKSGNWSRAIVATLVIVVLSAAAAEIVARSVFGLETLQYRRPYQPIFVSGDYHYLMPNERLPFVPGGAAAMSYREGRFGFHYEPDTPPPRTTTGFTDFLFAHNMSRYSAAEVDRLSCEQPDALLVFVLGGSVAQGFASYDKADTWHARLELLLRRKTGREDVYLFNAAMGAFVTLQERLVYHLAVAPRRAHLVLFVNGYNDITIPANSGVRPGDPFQLGLRYSQLLTDGFMWWLARHSAIAHALLQNEFNGHVADYRRRLEQDDGAFKRHAEAIADTYVENMEEVLGACAARGQACLVGVQPARSLTAAHLGIRADDILSQKRIVEAYRVLLAKVAQSKHRDRFIDLTRIFDKGEKMQLYHDSVHPNFAGHLVMANALVAPTLQALRSATPVGPVADRCTRLR